MATWPRSRCRSWSRAAHRPGAARRTAPRRGGSCACGRDPSRPAIIAAGRAVLRRRAACRALAGMPLPRPRRQHQHDPRVGLRGHLVVLPGLEVGEEARAAGLRPAVRGQLDLALCHEQVGPLVDAVLLELLARREVDRDHPGLAVGAQHLGLVRLHVERVDVPGVHGVSSLGRARGRNHAATGSPRADARSAWRAIHSAPAWSLNPCARIEISTVSDAMLKIRSPSAIPSLSTSSENVIVATPFGPNQLMKARVARSVRVPARAANTATGLARSRVKAAMAS